MSSEDTLSAKLQRNLARKRKSLEWPYGHHLSQDKVKELQSLARNPSVRARGILEQIHRETSRYVANLARDVRECKNVQEASNFARWLQFSSVLDMLELFQDLYPNFVELRKSVKDLVYDCGEHFKGGRVDAKYGASDIAEINSKLDYLISREAKQVKSVDLPSDGV